tara:strand:- start:6791 stop:7036 length:246 start_codon:yes stop_codon:yes gene_type:complete
VEVLITPKDNVAAADTFEDLRVQFTHYATQQTYIIRDMEDLKEDVSEIRKTVFQVKWAILGGLGMYVLHAMGFIEFVKNVM